jgi:hypothetical protein
VLLAARSDWLIGGSKQHIKSYLRLLVVVVNKGKKHIIGVMKLSVYVCAIKKLISSCGH